MYRSKLTLVFCMAMCIALTACGPKGVDLKLNLEPGMKRVVFIESSIDGPQGKSTQNIDFLLEVASVTDDGTASINAQITRCEAAMAMADMQAAMLGDVSGPISDVAQDKSFSFCVGPKGEISKLSGLEGLVDEIVAKVETPEDSPLKGLSAMMPGLGDGAVTKMAVEQLVGPAVLERCLQMMFSVYPDALIKVGSSWSKQGPIGTVKGLDGTKKATVSARVDNNLTAALSTEIDTTLGALMPEDIPGAEMLGDSFKDMMPDGPIEGTGSGSMMIDEDTGWVKELEYTTTADGTMKMKNPMTGGEIELPMSYSSSFKIESYEE